MKSAEIIITRGFCWLYPLFFFGTRPYAINLPFEDGKHRTHHDFEDQRRSFIVAPWTARLWAATDPCMAGHF